MWAGLTLPWSRKEKCCFPAHPCIFNSSRRVVLQNKGLARVRLLFTTHGLSAAVCLSRSRKEAHGLYSILLTNRKVVCWNLIYLTMIYDISLHLFILKCVKFHFHCLSEHKWTLNVSPSQHWGYFHNGLIVCHFITFESLEISYMDKPVSEMDGFSEHQRSPFVHKELSLHEKSVEKVKCGLGFHSKSQCPWQ